MEEKRIALLGIIVEDMTMTEELNRILHEYSRHVVGRMGIPYHDRGIAIISIVLDAPQNVISSLSGKLGMVKGVRVKAVYQKAGKEKKE
ncbi:MAG: iron-only hydrogenase system regulator [bacterium]|nr:iron-only hydrogenase system regulator [bacterium]